MVAHFLFRSLLLSREKVRMRGVGPSALTSVLSQRERK
jgi:hypothetical protein